MDLGSHKLRYEYLDSKFQLGNLHSLYIGILREQPWAIQDYYKMHEIEEYQPAIQRLHDLYPKLNVPNLESLIEDVVIF